MPTPPSATVEGSQLILQGDWVLPNAAPALPTVDEKPASFDTVDLKNVSSWDSTLPSAIYKWQKEANKKLNLVGAPTNLQKLLALTQSTTGDMKKSLAITSRRYKAAMWLSKVTAAVKEAVEFLGLIFIHWGKLFKKREHFRSNDWLVEFQEAGANALPIVLFLSFLVGLILAFVSAIQLQLFGASIYVADLVGLSMTREMGALITAIIMAGRTGASYAARIGSMKRSEELDALRTMGLSPIDMVVLPKVAALTLMTPLLAVFSSFIGIFAGLLVGNSVLGLSVYQYINETAVSVPPKNLFIGLIKALVYGFLVAFAGAWRGMRCGDSADAVGRAATSAVVLSLTLIVIANAIFAILLNALKM